MTSQTNKLWLMVSDFGVSQRMLDIQHGSKKPTLKLPNFDKLAEEAEKPKTSIGAADKRDTKRSKLVLSEPLALELTEPGFAPDFLELGFPLVSEELRDAIGLDEPTIQWLDVDASGSTQAVIDKNYRIMRVLSAAKAVDTVRSDGETREIADASGDGVVSIWVHATSGPHQPPSAFFWLPDFTPPTPVFYESLKQVVLFTDEVAARVIAAGIDDVIFIDLENDGSQADLKTRG